MTSVRFQNVRFRTRGGKFGVWLLLIAAVGMIVGGVYATVREYQWIRTATVTEGKVVEIVARESTNHSKHGGRRTRIMYSPRVSFRGTDGREHTFVSRLSKGSSAYHVGQTVKVACDSSGEAQIVGFEEQYFLGLVLGGVGVFMGLICTVVLVSRSNS